MTVSNHIKLDILLVLVLIISACDAGIGLSTRSGSLDDDYVEEPLGNLSKKYENALVVSNTFIEKIISGDYESLYDDVFDDELKKLITKEQLVLFFSKVEKAKGKIKNYKKQQWGFFSGKENGLDLLYSTKIVEYENGMMKYLFTFKNDGEYKTVLGFHVKEREGVSPPGVY